LLPFQSFEDYPHVLAAADVHVSILNQDAASYALPSKVMSQLCASRPQVAATPAENYVASVVRDADAGIICSPDDADGFCRVIHGLLDDQAAGRRLGENGRRYAERELSLKVLTPAYERLLEQLINASPENQR
jgi:glycosyltransferase involved in cell wall biosynthesis